VSLTCISHSAHARPRHADSLSLLQTDMGEMNHNEAVVASLACTLHPRLSDSLHIVQTNTGEMNHKKKEIARLLTAKRQKELDAGVTKRESRRRKTKKLVQEGMVL
jgi:ribosomal protein L29